MASTLGVAVGRALWPYAGAAAQAYERPKCAAYRVEIGWHDDAGDEQVVAVLSLVDEHVPVHARRVRAVSGSPARCTAR